MRCGIEELLSIGAAGWAVVATSSSTAAELALATGSAAAVSEDGLHLVDPDVAREAWVRPGVDLGVYRGIYLMPAGISFRAVEAVNRRLARDSVAEFPVPDGTRLRMRGHFREVFTGA
ncbi:MAG TPA: hypothetical protein VLD39_01845, partial [Gammaproteobacteria bacterium]|nr:hypothetical protein [Gammaproteobacteria bacterium]